MLNRNIDWWHDSHLRIRKQLGHGMTYEEAIAMYPHDSVHIQVDDVVRPMTPKEYEAFIERQVNAPAPIG